MFTNRKNQGVIKFLSSCWILGLLGGQVSCTSSTPPSEAKPSVSVYQDDAYWSALKKWKQEITLLDQFQMKAMGTAVLLTPPFQEAYQARFKQLYGSQLSDITQSDSSKLGVFISLFTPEDTYLQIDDAKVWNLEVWFGDQKASVIQTKPLKEKEILSHFYPFINHWTKEYILFFDYPKQSNTGSGNPPNSVLFLLKGPPGTLEFKWQQSTL